MYERETGRKYKTCFSSLETDYEYRTRLRACALVVTPAATKGVRVRDIFADRGEGVIIAVAASKITGIDHFSIMWDAGLIVSARTRNEFSVLPLNFDTLDSASLDKIGDMVGLQRKIVERLA